MEKIFNADKPIENAADDVLGRAYFAKKLAHVLADTSTKDGLVIGVYGKWGSGKTSLVNMALEELDAVSEDVVVRFSPWNYSSADLLIPEFFGCIDAELNNKKHKDISKKIGKALTKYKEAFQLLGVVPTVGGFLATIGVFASERIGKFLSRDKTISERKRKLEDALSVLDKRIIVVIDDIDRLDKTHIRNLFQLVKQVADFSNITYVLLMDEGIVARALEDVQDGDGYDYIEKIVQVPIAVPEISVEKINDYFLNKLNEVVGDEGDIDANYWSTVYFYCVKHCLGNLRDVNRLINVLTFKTNLLKNEICVEDIVALSAVEIKEPGFYEWIANNKEILCGSGMHYAYTYNRKPEDIRKGYEVQLDSIVSDVKWAVECLAVLFPTFARDTNEYISGGRMNDSESELRATKRISSGDRFELYFGMDVEALPISRSMMKKVVFESDEKQIEDIIEKMIKSNNIAYFLNELQAIDKVIPDERIELFMDIILKYKTGFWIDCENVFMRGRDSYRAQFIFNDLFIRLSVDERCNYLCSRIEEADDTVLEAIGDKVNELLTAYGLIGKNPRIDSTKQLIPVEMVQQVEDCFRNRIESLASQQAIHLEKELRNIEFYWLNRDEEGYDKYLKTLFEDKTTMLKYVAKRAGTWSSSTRTGYTYKNSDIERYASIDSIKETIKGFDKAKMINEFTENQLIKLATLVLEDFDTEENVTSERAKKLVEEWRG